MNQGLSFQCFHKKQRCLYTIFNWNKQRNALMSKSYLGSWSDWQVVDTKGPRQMAPGLLGG